MQRFIEVDGKESNMSSTICNKINQEHHFINNNNNNFNDQSNKHELTNDYYESFKSSPNKKLRHSSDTFGYFGNCKICKDRATGIHYGIASCEGCKVCFVYIYFQVI
jgi:hypothetical protein